MAVAVMMVMAACSPSSFCKKPAMMLPPTPPTMTMKKVKKAVPMPRSR